jgi:hypothetical protein
LRMKATFSSFSVGVCVCVSWGCWVMQAVRERAESLQRRTSSTEWTDGAGGVNQSAARFEQGDGSVDDLALIGCVGL